MLNKLEYHIPEKILEKENVTKVVAVLQGVRDYVEAELYGFERSFDPSTADTIVWVRRYIDEFGGDYLLETTRRVLECLYNNKNNHYSKKGTEQALTSILNCYLQEEGITVLGITFDVGYPLLSFNTLSGGVLPNGQDIADELDQLYTPTKLIPTILGGTWSTYYKSVTVGLSAELDNPELEALLKLVVFTFSPMLEDYTKADNIDISLAVFVEHGGVNTNLATYPAVENGGEDDELLTSEIVKSGSEIDQYCPEYQAVYSAFVIKPDLSIAVEHNKMVEGWVATGVWAKKDVIYVFAVHTNTNGEALLNWKNPGTDDAVLVNDPTFTAFKGFKMDGATQHIETYNPTVSGGVMVQDSAAFSIYIMDNIDEAACDLGGYETTPDIAFYIYSRTSDTYLCRTNDYTSLVPANTDSRGMHINTRTAAAVRAIYKNKMSIGNDTEASTGLINFKIPVGASDEDGVIGARSSKQYAYVAFGEGETQQNVDDETDFLEAYMDSNGEGVIA